MWCKVLRAKLLYWWSQTYHPDASGTHERYGALRALDPTLFTGYRTSSACVYAMAVIYPDLARYTAEIKRASRWMTLNQLIENQWCAYAYQNKSLDQFLINEHGLYLDPVSEVLQFKRSAEEFFTLYTAIRHSHLEIEGHNARILSKFESHLLLLIRSLLDYSYRCS